MRWDLVYKATISDFLKFLKIADTPENQALYIRGIERNPAITEKFSEFYNDKDRIGWRLNKNTNALEWF